MMNLTPGLHRALAVAAMETEASRWPQLERGHLLAGLCSLGKDLQATQSQLPFAEEYASLSRLLARCQMDEALIRRQVRVTMGTADRQYAEGETVPLGPAVRNRFARAQEIAEQLTAPAIGCLHVLASMLEDPGATILNVFGALGYSLDLLRGEMVEGAAGLRRNGAAAAPAGAPNSSTVFEAFGRDLTRLAAEQKLTPLVGRRQEMQQVLQILAKKTKSNPVLIGEPGVGKTAIVEGLAQRIAAGKNLAGRRIIEINLASLLSGSGNRGDLEARLTQLIDAVKREPEVILFIDEIHNLANAGDVRGGMGIAEILKPVLARGEISCIGASTTTEYRRHIEKDPALERRFETVLVEEPTPEETIDLLGRLAPGYEKHHGVRIDRSAIDAAVQLSVRRMPARRLPDKAIDLLDAACAQMVLPELSAPAGRNSETRAVVTAAAVEEVVAARTGIPLAVLRTTGADLERLQERLQQRVFGQDEAVAAVARAVRRARAGFRDPRKPQAVLMFLGSSGVGKTFLAQALAEELFPGAEALIRFDMSEFMEEHSVSKLLGAPPGYAGYNDEGLLTSRLRAVPHSVVLLDEMDKAHPRVWDIFLQLFDDGRLTDSHGRLTLAEHCIFILTGNLPPAERPRQTIGFGESAAPPPETQVEAPEQFRRRFRPEFWNRIDATVIFRPLSRADGMRIIRRRLQGIQERLRDTHGARLDFDEPAVEWLAGAGIDEARGARELARLISRQVEDPLTDAIFDGKLGGRAARLTAEGDRLVLRIE